MKYEGKKYMPYTMTHLIITEKLGKIFSKHIKNLPQFYLGNIAPDAIHNRINYHSDYKKISHLCIGEEKWGMITNNGEWKNNVMEFLKDHKNSINYDFILGYCTHLLSDIYNNITLWIPFKEKYADEMENGIVNIMLQETNMIDIELALTHESKDIFWSYINKSISIDLEEIIFAKEIDKQKDNILNKWYTNKKLQDLTLNKVVTLEIIMNFIENAVNFVEIELVRYIK